LPQLKALQQKKQSLLLFSDHISFPENGLIRYDSLKNKWIPLEGERNTIALQVQSYKEKVLQLKETFISEKTYDKIKKLLTEKNDEHVRKIKCDELLEE